METTTPTQEPNISGFSRIFNLAIKTILIVWLALNIGAWGWTAAFMIFQSIGFGIDLSGDLGGGILLLGSSLFIWGAAGILAITLYKAMRAFLRKERKGLYVALIYSFVSPLIYPNLLLGRLGYLTYDIDGYSITNLFPYFLNLYNAPSIKLLFILNVLAFITLIIELIKSKKLIQSPEQAVPERITVKTYGTPLLIILAVCSLLFIHWNEINSNQNTKKYLQELHESRIQPPTIVNGKIVSCPNGYFYDDNDLQEALSVKETVCEIHLKQNPTQNNMNLAILGEFPHLRVFYWVNANLDTFPKEIANAQYLETIYAYNNKLTTLPDIFSTLKNLRNFTAYDNLFAELPSALTQAPALEIIRMSGNQITALPNTIGNLGGSLKRLTLSKNELKDLPENFSQLTNLSVLYLDRNNFETIPEPLVKLMETGNLGIIDLRNNKIKTLPDLTKAKFKMLRLSGNAISFEEISALRKKLADSPEAKIFGYREIESNEKPYWDWSENEDIGY